MDLFGILLILVGAYLVSSAVKNRRPLRTLADIVRDPKSANTVLSAANGNGYVSGGEYESTVNASGVQSKPRVIYNNFGDGSGSSSAGSQAVAFAKTQIGKPYRLGAVGPNAWDCSSLVQAAWSSAGYSIPRTTYAQIASADLETIPQPSMPGDLIYPHAGHVVMFTGNPGEIVEAPRTGLNVRTSTVPKIWLVVRRPVKATHKGL